MKMFLGMFLIVVVSFISFFFWASYPWSLEKSVHSSSVKEIETDEMVDIPEHPTVIKLLTYNMGFLYGEGSEGPGYKYQTKEYFLARLEEVARQFKDWEADILFLQEIDFNSARSHYINQAEFIAKKAGYPFVAEAVSWDANYIPFPYWPIKNNFGQMSSGGAILSKYPLKNHQVILLEKPASQPWWYNLFYLHRYFQKVNIEVGQETFTLVNLHLEAFDKINRQNQIKDLALMASKEKLDFVVGDFNMLPASASKRSSFYNDDNYENDASYELMINSGLAEVVPDEIYAKDEALYFTFPSWAPDRRLDYIFYRPGLKMMKAEVLPSALSDHLPLRASFQIGSPQFNLYSQ